MRDGVRIQERRAAALCADRVSVQGACPRPRLINKFDAEASLAQLNTDLNRKKIRRSSVFGTSKRIALLSSTFTFFLKKK